MRPLLASLALLAAFAPGRADAQASETSGEAVFEAEGEGAPEETGDADAAEETDDADDADAADEGADETDARPMSRDAIFTEPSAELDVPQPTGPAATPQGYDGPRRRPRSRRSTVHMDALSLGERDLTLHVRLVDGMEPMIAHCTAPCVLELPRGRYEFEVQPRGGGPRGADGGPHYVSGERIALQMSYDHRIGLRSVGWTFVSLSVSAFAVSWVGGLFGALIFGLPIAAALLIPAIPLIFLEDSARVQLTPIPLQ